MRVMVPLANGFEEIEAMSIIDVLRRGGIEVHTVGVISSVIEGAHGVRVMVDKRLNEVDPNKYDGIILPGGYPGYVNLGRSSKLVEMLKKLHAKKKLIGAICGSPSILAENGLLEDKRATVYPGLEKKLPYPRGDRVVTDGNIITSQAPGTAIEFALEIVKYLSGDNVVQRLKRELVV